MEVHGVGTVVEVRTISHSRHNPQADDGALRCSLNAARIRYQHMSRLGALRHARKGSPNTGWINASFRGFVDYMRQKGFQRELRDLQVELRKRRTAIMCAEAFVTRCHWPMPLR